jgi:hypothetical protein
MITENIKAGTRIPIIRTTLRMEQHNQVLRKVTGMETGRKKGNDQ